MIVYSCQSPPLYIDEAVLIISMLTLLNEAKHQQALDSSRLFMPFDLNLQRRGASSSLPLGNKIIPEYVSYRTVICTTRMWAYTGTNDVLIRSWASMH